MICLETSGNERGVFAREIKREFVQRDWRKEHKIYEWRQRSIFEPFIHLLILPAYIRAPPNLKVIKFTQEQNQENIQHKKKICVSILCFVLEHLSLS